MFWPILVTLCVCFAKGENRRTRRKPMKDRGRTCKLHMHCSTGGEHTNSTLSAQLWAHIYSIAPCCEILHRPLVIKCWDSVRLSWVKQALAGRSLSVCHMKCSSHPTAFFYWHVCWRFLRSGIIPMLGILRAIPSKRHVPKIIVWLRPKLELSK